MFTPERAAVRPRAISPETGDAVPLESVVIDLLERDHATAIQIIGGPGSGKTAALRHLSAVLPSPSSALPLDDANDGSMKREATVECSSARVMLLDDATPSALAVVPSGQSVIFTGRKRLDSKAATIQLATWTQDDLIEYLLAACPAQCGRVMHRVQGDVDRDEIAGNPALWRLVLDEFAADGNLLTIREAIERALRRALPSL